MATGKAKCGQCGKPAIGQVGDVPLCVDCFTKLQNAHTAAANAQIQMARHAMAMTNQAMAEMDSIVGFPTGPRIQIPPMPATTGPVTFNNIKLDNSVVGAINTGTIHTIDVDLTHLRGVGNDKAAGALRALTEAVASEKSLTPQQRNELLDQVAFLSGQAAAPQSERKPGMIRSVLTGISQAAATVTGVATAWNAAEPILKGVFGP